ncbi:MAG TPA: TonB-dependent receptor [Longimicrobiaceae bacterium]|nr:TonB-dependent receptor [Longimicrobiaceae bacterium]
MAAGGLVLPASLQAQATGQVTGTVTSTTGTPLSGAAVRVQGTGRGAVTGQDGKYVITGVPTGAHTLQASLLGYTEATQPITVGSGQAVTADFQLAAKALQLEGLVAVGYGTQQRKDLTGAVAAVNTEELDKRPVANATEALQGMAPGLTVIDRGGRPGDAGTMFFIRGRGTLNSTSPLVLIDGVEGDLNAIDANDIASISVLKDAASAAIYGSRAANGVILVTTKRGKPTGDIQISYNGYYGIQGVETFPTPLGPRDYLELIDEAYVNAGLEPRYSQEYIDNTVKAVNGDPSVDPLKYPWTDWLDVVFNPAPIQNHTLSFRGGSDLATFSLSLNYMNQQGLIAQTAADRYSLRLNSDFHPTKKLDTGLDVALRRTSNIEPQNMGGVLWNMFHDAPPTTMAKYPDGTYGWGSTGNNPLAYAEAWGRNTTKYLHGRVDAKADYQLLDGLTIRTLGSVQAGDYGYRSWRNQADFHDYWNPDIIDKRISQNRLDDRKSNDSELYLRGLLEYKHAFGDHSLTAMAGYEQTDHHWEEIRAIRQGFYNNDLQEINVGDASQEDTWGTSNDWALRSGFGRLNYEYAGKYLFEANARYDGSSRFAKGHRYGFFPSLSAGWRISQEPFFKNHIGFIDDLKLRGSWGEMGNQDISVNGNQLYYPYWSLVSLGHDYVFGGQLVNGAAIDGLANRDISWESTTMSDLGLDAVMLNGRLSFTGDIYRKDTNNILQDLPIPGIIGLDAPVQNALSIRNTGWEATAGWSDLVGGFNYSVNLNLAHNTNEVTDLAGTGPYISGWWLTQEGYPLGTIYGYKTCGLFQSQAEVDAHATQAPQTGPGDICYVDQNNDNVVNNLDRVPLGSDMPALTYGSTWTAGWKGFDASVFFQGAWGVHYYIQGALVEGPFWENYTTTAWLDRWTPDNPNGRMPKPTLRLTIDHQVSDWWVYDVSYVKVKNAQFGYTLPHSVARPLHASNLRLYVSGQNLLTWTKSPNAVLDPEAPSGRGNVYPPVRTVSVGVSASF